MLTPEEILRYDRQIIFPGFGENGQEKLKNARVLIAGGGGLGSPVAIYLAVAGIGTLRVIDYDRVELSNLNRQILHWEKDLGLMKVASAAEKLHQINRYVTIETVSEYIDASNVEKFTEGFDVIVDAMDNLPTRFLLNQAAVTHKIPFVHGAVHGLEGRVMTIIPGKTACLGCIYLGVPPKEKFPILGTTPGVIGTIQATEVMKIILGLGNLLTDRFLIFDGVNMNFTELKIHRRENCRYCGKEESKR